jgi:hypothetical protein
MGHSFNRSSQQLAIGIGLSLWRKGWDYITVESNLFSVPVWWGTASPLL